MHLVFVPVILVGCFSSCVKMYPLTSTYTWECRGHSPLPAAQGVSRFPFYLMGRWPTKRIKSGCTVAYHLNVNNHCTCKEKKSTLAQRPCCSSSAADLRPIKWSFSMAKQTSNKHESKTQTSNVPIKIISVNRQA